MKKITVLFLLLFGIGSSFSQSVYVDALALRKYCQGSEYKFDGLKGDPDGYMKILLRDVYIPKEDTIYHLKLGADMYKYFTNQKPNPFLADFFSDGAASGISVPDVVSNRTKSFSSPLGLDIPTIADGIAKFLVERFKEEMTITFFDQLKEKLNSKELEELRILFPNTFIALNAIDKNIYQFSGYLNMLRESFEKDLSEIHVNAFKVLRSDRFQSILEEEPVLKGVFNLGTDIAEGIVNKDHPGKMVEHINMKNIIDISHDNDFIGTVILFKEISKSFYSGETESYWLPAQPVLDSLRNDSILLKIYWGLLYQRVQMEIKHLPAPYNTTVTNPLKAGVNGIDYFKVLHSIIDITNTIEKNIQKIKTSDDNDLTYQDIYNYYSSTISIFEECGTIYKEIFKKELPPEYNLSIYVAKTAGQIYLDANQRNYASAVLNTVTLIDTLFQTKFLDVYYNKNILTPAEVSNIKVLQTTCKDCTPAINDIDQLVTNKNYYLKSKPEDRQKLIGLITDTTVQNKVENLYRYGRLRKVNELVDAILKYGNFAASVAQAQTSDQVKEVIKSMVLPAGSSAAKTYTSFSIALNGYVGVAVGHDFDGKSTDVFNSASVWAPVGLSFNWGTKKKSIGYIGLTTTIIDLGALISFRWDDSTTSVLPQFNARNLLAPGAYISLGRIANTPITFSIGGQYGPQLRSLTATKADVVRDSWRVGMTLSCDIPFFYVYRKPMKRN